MEAKLNSKRILTTTEVQSSSSSSEDDETEVVEKISVQLKSHLALSNNKDFDPFVLLTEAQQALNLSSTEKSMDGQSGMETTEVVIKNKPASVTYSALEKARKKTKHIKQRSHYYQMSIESGHQSQFTDSIYYHSDGEGPCSYNCNHMRTAGGDDDGAKALSPATRCISSTGGSSSLFNKKCLMRFSDLIESICISVMDDENPTAALSKILSIKEFDPLAPQLLASLIIKSIVSLSELSKREDNIINVDIDKRRILEFSSMSQEGKRNCRLNPFMDVSNIVVTHPDNEFFTFCLCKNCEEYRELAIHIMVEQFKADDMVAMLLEVLIKAYGPMLKNITAYNKFNKLLESNKEIYWLTRAVIYHKKGEHVDFIFDENLSDNMIFVLFSSILMLNNPLLLLQILAFHVECIVKAYAEGFLQLVKPDQRKIPADVWINYILNGYDDLIRISEHVASYLFAFENWFLRKFSLTWKLLCQRLYQQHVHFYLADTMLACIITMKQKELTSHHSDLIKRYIQFDDIMSYAEKRWTDVWIELNKFNLSEVERNRRKSLLDVYRIFDTVVQDAIAFSLQDSIEEAFCDFRSLKNRRLAWFCIIYNIKLMWPDGFYQPPNTLVVDDKCKKCNVSLEYHAEFCKCITCSIAGGPLPPSRNADGKCSKCLAHEIVEKDVNFYDSKIVNVCASDDFLNLSKNNNGAKRKNSALQEVGQELYSTLASAEEILSDNSLDKTPQASVSSQNAYHISWAVFNHLNNRKRFPHTTIVEQHFCHNCKMASCQLARKILRNEISPSLSKDLIHYYQPVSMSREELRSILPNIKLYNQKLVAYNYSPLDLVDVHDLVVKIYWIFIISIYAIYFIDFDDENDDQVASLNLDALELTNNDISVNLERIVGNKDDTKFLEFLDKIKSLSPSNNDVESNRDAVFDTDSGKFQKKLSDILTKLENQETSQGENIPPPLVTPTEELEPPPELTTPCAVESQPKKSCKEKAKKCCFDHSDIGDHCKENHSNKKRLNKDCNHARMNETRERLRKKLSQIVNARKNCKTSQIASASATAVAAPTAETQNQMENVLNADELKLFQHFQQQLPHSASWEGHTIAATFEQIHQATLNDLCGCLQHQKTNAKSDNKVTTGNEKSHDKQSQQKIRQTSLEPPNKKSNVSNNSTRDASTSSQGAKSKDGNSVTVTHSQTTSPPPAATPPTISAAASSPSVSKEPNNLDFVSEICEIIDNYSKEQAKRKWIKETLSFIEGPTTATGKKKSQPQTLNPKKAAKKAKQKQRKEEEKRITELHDLRAQFHNIYFKEFTDKLNLKSLKASKKQDKKKLSELETNIKNLQRAKAKVETAILELIATVKQTNAEFKFSYLPTKEQQIEKVKELEAQKSDAKENHGNAKKTKVTNVDNVTETTVPLTPFTMTQANNLNMVPETYSMPYAHANHFPYNLGFPPPAAPAPFGLMRATPMCYAPPPGAAAAAAQQQQLGPEVVAAMAANATSSSANNSDPSKRIVTIRRVNLPNVPEPQVTVTAKGSSPDKDKLLYTFINGQLVQTGTSPPIGIPQMSVITPMQPPATPISSHLTKLPPEHLLTIPPPPPPKLSKTQMKKERRRLAKLQAEAEAAEEAERKRLEDEHERLRALEVQKQLELQQQQKLPKKKKKMSAPHSQTPQSSSALSSSKKDMKTELKHSKLATSNSTTSVSTNENNESSPKLPQKILMQKAIKPKRSASTTTSCSAATSSSSNNSTSSQVNTRDNSASSLKPGNPKSSLSKKISKEQKILGASNTCKTKVNNGKGCSNKKPTPPTSSTVSSEDEAVDRSVAPSSQFSSKSCKTNNIQQRSAKQKAPKVSHPKINKTKTPPSSDTEDDAKTEQPQVTQNRKVSKKRRPKLIDSAQFDNNPFKSLHMLDSDTAWYSSEEDTNRDDELDLQMNNLTANVQINTTELPVIAQKKESKVNNQTTQKSNQVIKKKPENYSKENKKQDSPATREVSDIKGTAKQQTKHSSNKVIKTQTNEKLTTSSKQNISNKSHRQPQQDEESSKKNSNQRLSKHQTLLQAPPTNGSNRKLKSEGLSNITSSSSAQNTKSNVSGSVRPNNNTVSTNSNRTQPRNATRNSSRKQTAGGGSNQQPLEEFHNSHQLSSTGNSESKNKRSQRNKKYQQTAQKSNQSLHLNCCSSGIPNNMGYFNPNEVNIATSTNSVVGSTQNHTYQSLAEQMQALRLSGNLSQQITTPAMGTAAQHQQRLHITSNNVSIMDQLNRGVQVENLSLPPGITLTKVDPIKSEQLRQKSESIKKLAKPLQQPQQLSQTTQAFHNPTMGTTIIAPPVTPMSNYYSSSYSSNAGIASSATLDPQSGIIMVEANPPKTNTASSTSTAASSCSNNKQSKNKKRRNKSKASNNASCPLGNSGTNSGNPNDNKAGAQPKMITLRNPMFHGATTPAAPTMLQQTALTSGRSLDAYPMAASLAVDQPAAIIKNENGMYTIRNPALHQAVTNGLVIGGYRQFGNVNYYTPQEAAAEAARATMQQQLQQHSNEANKTPTANNINATSFSYFSNDVVPTNASHNNISISCTSVVGGSEGASASGISPQRGGGLSGDAAVIQRPTPAQKCISAIGSEIKSAQQQKQKSKEQHWSHFVSEALPLIKSDNLACNTSFLGSVAEGANSTAVGADMTLQEKYQQSKYYNGFDVFAGSSGGSSSSATACAHIHHSCGDDSPPPSITGYNSYLDGIPNTGVIRYDDASFLKNLIPGQNLNNEVSIHNVNDSNFARNAHSPQAHRVEITPVYSGNRPPSTNLFETNAGQINQSNFRGNYREQLSDYSNDSNLFSSNNLHLNLTELETSMKYDFEQPPTSVANVAPSDNQNSILDLNDLLSNKNGPTGSASHPASPYLDENTLEGFVQNMNSLHISSTASTVDEQSSQLNGSGIGHTVTTSANASNGWW